MKKQLIWQVFWIAAIASVALAKHTYFTECFSGSTPLEKRGFSVAHCVLDSSDGKVLAVSPGGWQQMTKLASPAFVANRSFDTVTVSWNVRFPTHNKGPSWREQNKVYMSLLGAGKKPLYTLLFKPNRKQDRRTSYDLRLKKYITGTDGGVTDSSIVLGDAWSHKVTPHGKKASFVTFTMTLTPEGTITVSYDAGKKPVEYISVVDSTYAVFNAVQFEYKTGSGDDRYHIEIDNIAVTGSLDISADNDRDGIANGIELAMAKNPADSTAFPRIAVPDVAVITNEKADQEIQYDFDRFYPEYKGCDGIRMRVKAGSIKENRCVPVIRVMDALDEGIPEEIPGHERLGRFIDFSGDLEPGAAIHVELPLPNIDALYLPDELSVMHYYNERWVEETIDSVTDSSVYVTLHTFSPVMVTIKKVKSATAYIGNDAVFEKGAEHENAKIEADIELYFNEFPMPDFPYGCGTFSCKVFDDQDDPYMIWEIPFEKVTENGETFLKASGSRTFDEKSITVRQFEIYSKGRVYTIKDLEKKVKRGQKLTVELGQEYTYLTWDDPETQINWFYLTVLARDGMGLAYTNINTSFGTEGRVEVEHKGSNPPELEEYFYHKDHLGSTRMVLDEDGNPVEANAYTAYGENIPLMENSYPVREKFTGKEHDTEGKFDMSELVLDLDVYAPELENADKGFFTVEYHDVSVGYEMEKGTHGPNNKWSFYLKKHIQHDDPRRITGLYMHILDTEGNDYVDYRIGVPDAQQGLALNTVKEITLYRTLHEVQNAQNNDVDLYEYEDFGVPPLVGVQLTYFGARYYDPELGVWISCDPAGQFFSPYAYAGYGANPVLMIDADGNFIFTTGFLIAAGVAATIGGVSGGVYAAQTDQNVFAGIGIGMGVGLVTALSGGAAAAGVGAATASMAAAGGWAGLGAATLSGAAAGAAGGFTGGFLNTMAFGNTSGFFQGDMGDAFSAGIDGMWKGAAIGGASSALLYGISTATHNMANKRYADLTDRQSEIGDILRDTDKDWVEHGYDVFEDGKWVRRAPGTPISSPVDPKAEFGIHTHPSGGPPSLGSVTRTADGIFIKGDYAVMRSLNRTRSYVATAKRIFQYTPANSSGQFYSSIRTDQYMHNDWLFNLLF